MLTRGLWRRRIGVAGAVLTAAVLFSAVSASATHYSGPHLATLNGNSQPVLWFVDYTDSSWPVTDAAIEWDRSSRVTMTRRTVCPDAGDYCVPVRQVTSLPNGDLGLAEYCVQVSPTHISRYGCSGQYLPRMRLSNETSMGTRRRSVACQEQGHFFSLNHRGNSTTSCMASGSNFPVRPDTHDFDQAYYIYGHTH